MPRSSSNVATEGADTRIEDSRRGERDTKPQTSDCVFSVSDLRKAFTSPSGERIEVLRGIDLSADAGEMIAITGASGSGKSTLLQLLGGLDEPDHGTILLNQFELSRSGGDELARFRRHQIGFVFQFHHLIPDLSATENVALPLLIARLPFKKAISRANETLESIGLARKGHHPVGQLSGGEQQKIAVARALITEPSLVLADEPTGNLDAVTGEELAEFLVSYCRTRRALAIVATHSRAVAEICDRILTIQDGRLRPNSIEHI